jgi:DNA-binding response OmpR family regulator
MIERKMPIPAALRRLAVRIAVIDDDAGFIDAISCILGRERPDVELVSARDAFSGGLLVAESRPDVLVLGVGGLDAVDILRRLRASPDLSSVRVAVAMERVEPARRAAVEALGAIAVIEKPVDAATLLKVTGVLPPASPDEAAPG